MGPKRKSNRRQFLTGHSAAEALQDLAQGQVDPQVPDEPGGSLEPVALPYVVKLTRRAMACEFQLYLNAGQHPAATEAALAALDLVDQLEDQLSVYRDASEVMHLNRAAADGPITVEPGLFALLELAQRLHCETGGAFDITAGPLTRVWGFFRREGRVASQDEIDAALASVGSHRIELDAPSRSVRFTQSGIELNLGSIGKGYALDRGAELLAGAGVTDYLWHGGQSSVLARGTSGAREGSGPGWAVGIGHPVRAGRRLAQVYLKDRALGTSGATVQFFRHKGRRYGHIIDPRTGWPAEGVLSVTVLAPTAAEADALATAFYVLGPDAAAEFCRRRGDVGMLMLVPSSHGSSFELLTEGVEADDWQLLDGRRSGTGNAG